MDLRALAQGQLRLRLEATVDRAEGTLGIVTAAALKLFPRLNVSATAMVALDASQQAVDLLRFMQEQVGNRIEAFEIMSRRQVEIVL